MFQWLWSIPSSTDYLVGTYSKKHVYNFKSTGRFRQLFEEWPSWKNNLTCLSVRRRFCIWVWWLICYSVSSQRSHGFLCTYLQTIERNHWFSHFFSTTPLWQFLLVFLKRRFFEFFSFDRFWLVVAAIKWPEFSPIFIKKAKNILSYTMQITNH